MISIEVITHTTEEGHIKPLRLRIKSKDGSKIIINIDKIIEHNTNQLNGNIMFTYQCRAVVEGIERIFKINYELSTTKWFLTKI